MEQVHFKRDTSRDRRIVLWLVIAGGASLLLALTILSFGRSIPHWIAFGLSLAALVALGGLCGLLLTHYGRDPSVAEKRTLLDKIRKLSVEAQRVDSAIRQAGLTRKKISQDEQAALQSRQATHDSLLASLDSRRSTLRSQEKEELLTPG